MFEQRNAVEGFVFCISDSVDEVSYGTWRETATAQTRDRRHAGIVPSCHEPFFHKLEQLALRHDRICKVEAVELNLTGAVALVGKFFYEIFIQRTVRNKLKCADRVCDPFEIVALSVCEVIHRIDLPRSACAVVRSLDYAIHDGVTEVHVGACHVDLGTEHTCAFLKLSCVHALEKVKIFFYRTVAVRAFRSGLCRCSLLGCDLLRRLVIDVCLSLLDHAYGEIVELGEIIGCVIFTVAPVKSEPVDVFAD